MFSWSLRFDYSLITDSDYLWVTLISLEYCGEFCKDLSYLMNLKVNFLYYFSVNILRVFRLSSCWTMTVLFLLHFTFALSALLTLIAFLVHLNYKFIRTNSSIISVVSVQNLEQLQMPNLMINETENLFSGSCFWICLSCLLCKRATLWLCCTIVVSMPGEAGGSLAGLQAEEGRAGAFAALTWDAFSRAHREGCTGFTGLQLCSWPLCREWETQAGDKKWALWRHTARTT